MTKKTAITFDDFVGALRHLYKLTATESKIAFWLAEGKTNWEIGVIVGCAARTVEKHMERILDKMQVENRTAAAVALAALARATAS